MPLSGQEQQHLMRRIADIITNEFGFTGPAQTEPVGAIQRHRIATEAGDPPQGFYIAAEQLLFRLDHIAELVQRLLEAGMPEQADKAEPDKPKGRVGRPPKPKPDAGAQQAAQPPQGNGATPPPPPAQQAQKDPADDMFPTDDKGDDDPLGIPDEPKQPEQPPLTDVQVKEVLRSYMQAWGAEGTPRLTDLLKRTANVSKFSDLPANKWAAVVDAAKKELAGRNA